MRRSNYAGVFIFIRFAAHCEAHFRSRARLNEAQGLPWRPPAFAPVRKCDRNLYARDIPRLIGSTLPKSITFLNYGGGWHKEHFRYERNSNSSRVSGRHGGSVRRLVSQSVGVEYRHSFKPDLKMKSHRLQIFPKDLLNNVNREYIMRGVKGGGVN